MKGYTLLRGLYTSVFSGGSVVKNLPAIAGVSSSIPGSGRFPGEENGNPIQYSCLENPKDRGAWRGYNPPGLKESDTTEHTHTFQLVNVFSLSDIRSMPPHPHLNSIRKGGS